MKNSIQKKTLLNRALSVIMTLVIVFSPMFAAYAVENGESIDEAYAFNQDTIRNFIDLHLEQQFVDEEFYHAIAQAYQASPATFAELISDYSSEEIIYLAKGIAYDLQKTGASVPRNSNSASATLAAIQSVIASGSVNLNDVCQTGFDLFDTEIPEPTIVQIPGHAELQSVNPSISTITYTSGQLVVGQVETLNVTFSKTSNSSSSTYWVEIYQRLGSTGSDTLKSSKSITFPAGTTSLSVNFNMAFYDTGSIYTVVKVFSSQGGSVLATRMTPTASTVYGKWSISVILPENRANTGDLYLYRATGTVVMRVDCLGQSKNGTPMTQEYGNTPTGTYRGWLAGPVNADNVEKYGPYKYIEMVGVSGVIVTSGRSGIWIHGGRDEGNGILQPTEGCVRVSNASQLALQETISDMEDQYYLEEGRITISD